MNRIYYGREHIDKNKFMFGNMEGESLLIVPDQYTLQAERDAFDCLKTKGFMNLEVISLSRLSSRVIDEVGIDKPLLSKQGRAMILSVILKNKSKELDEFSGYEDNASFIEITNNLISEMKQFNVTVDQLKEVIDQQDESLLDKKLKDVAIVFEEYEKIIGDSYIDSEDYIAVVAEKIGESQWLKNKNIWIYGFDYFTEKNLLMLKALMESCQSVNILMTYEADNETFDIVGTMMEKIKELDPSIEISQLEGESVDPIEKSPAMMAVERGIFAIPSQKSDVEEDVTLVAAANYYNEAESAAQYILSLVRDEGYRFSDIVMICNDLGNRGKILKRVFKSYGVDLFVDNKRDIMYTPVVSLILASLDMIRFDMSTKDVIKFLKTGLALDEEGEELHIAEEMEVYAKSFNIKGSYGWKREFTKGFDYFGEETVKLLEQYRGSIYETIKALKSDMNGAETVAEKVDVIYSFLVDGLSIPEKLEKLIEQQMEKGQIEQAEETAQVWNTVLNILAQQRDIIGSETMNLEGYISLLEAGFASVEIGLLPPTVDGLVVGTIQRLRPGRAKAIVIVGANEGVLPATINDDGLLTEDEKQRLLDKGLLLCKLNNIRRMEEKLAIYRNLSSSVNKLYVSYAIGDEEGKELFPSEVFNEIKDIFHKVKIQSDIVFRGDPKLLISNRKIAFEHLITAIQRNLDGEPLDEFWKYVVHWFKGKEEFDLLENIFMTEDEQKTISELDADFLYRRGDGYISLSPSRLEMFGRCPFAHFVKYGLRPKEPPVYQILPMDTGNLAHFVMMRIAEELSKDGKKPMEDGSLWKTSTVDDIKNIIDSATNEYIEDYRDGLFEENYKTKWIKEMCLISALEMISQLNKGLVKSIKLEEPFGIDKNIPPINILDKNNVIIEGVIDRIDTLAGDAVKIIDYKSGNDKFRKEELLKGWKFQLFVYLQAALEGTKTPAGAYYFHIKDGYVSVDGIGRGKEENVAEEKRNKEFKVDGVVVNEPDIVDGIDEGILSSKKNLISSAEFNEIYDQVVETINELAKSLVDGNIAVSPMKNMEHTPCEYCKFKGICKFDESFDSCNYRTGLITP